MFGLNFVMLFCVMYSIVLCYIYCVFSLYGIYPLFVGRCLGRFVLYLYSYSYLNVLNYLFLFLDFYIWFVSFKKHPLIMYYLFDFINVFSFILSLLIISVVLFLHCQNIQHLHVSFLVLGDS